jgi:hypothetical protein
MKKCSTSLARKEVKINKTLRFYLTPFRMATIKKISNNTGEVRGEKGTLIYCYYM